MTDTTEQAHADAGSGDPLEELRTQVRGQVLTPADPGYADGRVPYNAMHTGQPDLIVRCSGTADVVDAVNYARQNGLPVAVRGGGHSIAGLSTIDGGMLIDLSTMRGVQVDPDHRVAHVQGGALWGDVDREAQAFGLATPGGLVSETGVGGLTLGGGYGWLRRKYGLSCDSALDAQVVGADGEIRTASAESNPDLFWAIRGGGGNFGIVTGFTFRLYPVGPIVPFNGVFYAAEDVAQVVRGWREYAAGAPDEVTSIVVVFTFPADPHMPEVVHDRPVCIVGGMYAGGVEEGMQALQPLQELATPLFVLGDPLPYAFVQSAFDPLFQRQSLRSYWKSQYVDDLSDAAIDTFADIALNRPTPLSVANLWHMGGAIAQVDPQETAFFQRSWPFMVSIDGNWSDPSMDSDVIAWVRSSWSRVAEHGTGSVYLNFTGLSDEDEGTATSVDLALGENLRRLAEVKETYDPDNFFRRNNNIRPA